MYKIPQMANISEYNRQMTPTGVFIKLEQDEKKWYYYVKTQVAEAFCLHINLLCAGVITIKKKNVHCDPKTVLSI